MLSISVILELILLIVFLARERTRNIPEKNLIAFCFVLLMCDIALILPLTMNSLDKIPCKTKAILLYFFFISLMYRPAVVAYEYYKIPWCRNLTKYFTPTILYNCIWSSVCSSFNMCYGWYIEWSIVHPIWKTGLLLGISILCTIGCIYSTIFYDEFW